MELGIQLIVQAVFGLIVAMIGASRGRSGVGWFFIGFFLGCIGLILVLVLPDLKAQEAKELKLRRENRRLRERLSKDRMVSDQRHQDVSRRLRAHDRALGVDTAEQIEGGASPHGHIGAPPPPSGGDGSYDSIVWHVQVGGDTQGPILFEELRDLWDNGSIQGNTYVWHEELPEWQRIDDLAGLRETLNG